MGTLKRMGLGFKAGLGKQLSRADIYSYCEGLIQTPPIPAEWKRGFDLTLFKRKGVPLTVGDYYREELLKPALDKIAAAPTHAMQRAECLREIMDYDHWINMNACLNAARTDIGRAMTDSKLKTIFAQIDDRGHRALYLAAWSQMAFVIQGTLLTLGRRLLGISKETEWQMELCREYGREVMMIHVTIMDQIWENYADDPDRMRKLAGWKDDYINPITDRMINLVEASKNKVIHGAFDRTEFATAARKLGEERAKAEQLIS
jgi:hypothetical protein